MAEFFCKKEFFCKNKGLADRRGFELAVRLEEFAFEFPAEFPALFAKLGFRENFAPEVLDERISPVSPVRLSCALEESCCPRGGDCSRQGLVAKSAYDPMQSFG